MTRWFVILMKDRVCHVLMTDWVRDVFGWLIDFGIKRHGVTSARLRGACWSSSKKIDSPLSSWFRWMIVWLSLCYAAESLGSSWRCSKRYLLLIATQCNTLQHTATHCNTLQHTATHFKKIPTPHWVCSIQMSDCIGAIWVLELCGSFQEMYRCLRFTTY